MKRRLIILAAALALLAVVAAAVVLLALPDTHETPLPKAQDYAGTAYATGWDATELTEACRWFKRLDDQGIVGAPATHRFAIGAGYSEDDARAVAVEAAKLCPAWVHPA